ncbi:MAG: ABC transporter permease [Bacteroidia bacterium]|jgi:ABC-2 type transport system permease protein
MGKIGLIIKREFLSRVKKKSFIIMTLLGPIIMGAVMIIPIWMASVTASVKTILVIDEARFVEGLLQANDDVRFVYSRQPLKKALAEMESSEYYALLHIPLFQDNDINHLQRQIKLYSSKQVSLSLKLFVRTQIEKQIERLKLQSQGVDQDLVDNVKKTVNVPLDIIPLGEKKESNVEVSTGLGFFGGFLIYFFIFMFASQVMRGVIEEKTNRIVEVIISSVKPFELMMGKIIGIALVGLTQFLLWVAFTASIYMVFMGTVVKDKLSAENIERIMQQSPEGTAVDDIDQLRETQEVIGKVNMINWGLMIPCFIFYFLGGYLLYGAIFAAIGGAVDSESDTQQFMLPVSAPLILSFVMAQSVLNDPNGLVATWMSVIPFTSPIIMMIRLPFGVHYTELLLSMGMLVVGFILTTWAAGKIYRTGILMYGKRPTWKEMFRWLRY